jgi:hypothetical protein
MPKYETVKYEIPEDPPAAAGPGVAGDQHVARGGGVWLAAADRTSHLQDWAIVKIVFQILKKSD